MFCIHDIVIAKSCDWCNMQNVYSDINPVMKQFCKISICKTVTVSSGPTDRIL